MFFFNKNMTWTYSQHAANALLWVAGTSFVVPAMVQNGVPVLAAVALTAVTYSVAVDWFVDFWLKSVHKCSKCNLASKYNKPVPGIKLSSKLSIIL